jgi:tRNA(fMet)-specific endonuclease VapC
MSNLFMLDTDTASYIIKGGFPTVEARLQRLKIKQVCISAVTRAELRFGVKLSGSRRLAAAIESFLDGIHTLPWDEVAADQFAEVRADLQKMGTPIGVTDTMIAAHAKAAQATLVTNNVKHFRRVKDLLVENWAG